MDAILSAWNNLTESDQDLIRVDYPELYAAIQKENEMAIEWEKHYRDNINILFK